MDKIINTENAALNEFAGENPEEGYFNSFPERLQQRLELIDELADAKILGSLAKENPFMVSAAYFDELPGIIGNKIPQTKSSAISQILNYLFEPRLAVPLLFIVLLFAISLSTYTKLNLKSLPINSELSEEYHLQTIDESLIVEALSKQPADDGEKGQTEIINYLIENDFDVNMLNAEL